MADDGKAPSVDHQSLRDEPDNAKSSTTAFADAGANQSQGGHIEMPEILRNMSPEERASLEKRLMRRIDLRLLPMLVIMYILNYIDRNNVSAAFLAGLTEELNLEGNQTSTAVSILFVGYLLMQVPSNIFLNKIGKPAIYLPTCMIIWGIISGATAGVTTYGGLLSIRFFLGFIEAAYFPGCLYYLSCWYTRKELGLRTTLLYSGALISGAFSGLIAAGVVGSLDYARGWRAWRWLFLIEGVITVFVAIFAFFILPNFPRTTTWLSEEERALAVWRLEEDIGQDDWTTSRDQTLWKGFRDALVDVNMWILLILVFCIVASGSVTNFFPIIVKTLQYDNVTTLLLTSPPYVLCFLTTCFNAWHADKTGERFFHISAPLALAVVAFIIAASTNSVAPRYVSMMLMLPGIYGAYTTALAWISNTLPRPPAKRAAALAFINAVSNCSSIYTSYLYAPPLGPRFVGAFVHNCVVCFLAICAAATLRLRLASLNRKLDQGIHVEGAINQVAGAGVNRFRFNV